MLLLVVTVRQRVKWCLHYRGTSGICSKLVYVIGVYDTQLVGPQVMSNSCYPMDCSLPDSFIHGISQARILECIAISFSRGSSWPRNRMWVSCITGRFFTDWVMKGAFFVVYVKHYRQWSRGALGQTQETRDLPEVTYVVNTFIVLPVLAIPSLRKKRVASSIIKSLIGQALKLSCLGLVSRLTTY